MCGIAGVMTADGRPPEAATLDAMARALAHRGPDGQGRRIEGSVGLVHVRLAIIDLASGAQPIVATEHGLNQHEPAPAIVANGEIYNYLELYDDLPGVRFKTRSDCEPPLHLYLRLGPEFARRLRGMYALAIHDPRRDRLVLARDPFGIKPLYYVETAHTFAFASEPEALLAAGLAQREERDQARNEVLQLQFTTGRETIFSGIHRVGPGETLVVEGGRIVERFLQPALPAAPPRRESEAAALERLDAAWQNSVDLHQRSDVPYGMFLSGGIDSSAVLAMMARLAERPVRAFTIGFPGTGVHDERDQARAVARAVGAEHVEVTFEASDFWALLPRVAACLDDPVADYAALPTYRLAAAVREAGLKVVLSGEGGDELFAGYGRYRRAARPRWLGGRPSWSRGILKGLDVLREPMASTWRAGVVAAEEGASGHPGWTRLQRAQAVDCTEWLPNDLLLKVDRCLMAHGVEGRVPFLDPVMAEVAFGAGDGLKLRGRRGKWLLRRWLELHLPSAKPFAPKKGFTVPVAEWIALRGRALGPLVAAEPGIARCCRPDAVARLFATPGRATGKAAWTLLFHALWHAIHVLGRPPGEDVVQCLEGPW